MCKMFLHTAEASMGAVWVGVLNPNFIFCNSKDTCKGKLDWIDETHIDGTAYDGYFDVSSN